VRIDWDAEGYHRISGPMEAMGVAVLGRLELVGDETVLDAGCGTGRVTAHLVERLPRGRVIAVDVSPEMVRQARAFLGPAVDVRQVDLLALELGEHVDAILSTATFHWILDHDRLFERLHALVRPGGQLVAQFGGHGNIASVLAAAEDVSEEPEFAETFRGFERPSFFATAEETAARLERSGFVDVRCRLTPSPVAPEDPIAYLVTISLRDHVRRLDADRGRQFAERVVGRLPKPVTIDYVRLDIDARRP
jgi:trans-aconitate 2-methyltransferase